MFFLSMTLQNTTPAAVLAIVASSAGPAIAAVLAAVGDHVDGDQLQGRDVDDQKCTHLVAGGPGRALPSVQFFF